MPNRYLEYLDFGRVETLIQNEWKWSATIEDPTNPRLDAIFPNLCNLINAAIDFSATRRNVTQEIRFCILDTDIENAVAFRLHQNTYCIAFTAEFFVKMMTFGSLMETTEPICAAFPKKKLEPMITKETFANFERRSGYPWDLQKEAWELSQKGGFGVGGVMATAFHELGHIINGHCGYHNNSAIFEIESGNSPNNNDNLEIIRALEYDADCFAMQEMIGFFHASPRRIAEHLCEGMDDHLRFAILATFVAFGGLGRNRTYDSNWLQTTATHPHPIDRARLVMATAATIVATANPSVDEALVMKELIVPLFQVGAEAFMLVTNRQFGSGNGENDAETYLEFIDRARRGWAAIRPKLTASKLGTHNLAPAR